MSQPRPEYPRPDFVRPRWLNLNGWWDFAFDDENKGLGEGWFSRKSFPQKILTPFPFQSENSGIAETGFHDIFWYRTPIQIPPDWRKNGRIFLHIGALDYEGALFINGKEAGVHVGGYVPWSTDITDFLKGDEAEIVIRGVDSQSKSQPRGKQHWELKSSGIQYTRVSGIWQPVWLEPVPFCRIRSIRVIPALNPDRLIISAHIQGDLSHGRLAISISAQGKDIVKAEAPVENGVAKIEAAIPSARRWSPDDPFLYDLNFKLVSGEKVRDEVQSYAGISVIARDGRKILLNEKPIRLKGILDQGYFPGGIYTPSTDEEMRRDVELTRQLGFNCARKHQKLEDPRWYYWCDRLGLLVWGEMSSAWEFTNQSCAALAKEWQQAMQRDWNHPCIMAWVPLNESWGVPDVANNSMQQNFTARMAQLTRSLDPTRPVVDNSGWCHVDTDIVDIHPYTGDPVELAAMIEQMLRTGEPGHSYPAPVWVGGAKDGGQPIVVSEYGGNALDADVEPEKGNEGGWGYGHAAQTPEDLLRRFAELTKAIIQNKEVAGYVYTQLTDVEQEKNGLLKFDRQPKAPIEAIAAAQKD